MSDQAVPQVTVRAYPGVEFHQLWGTEDGGASLAARRPGPTVPPFFPGPGGTRLLLVRYAPESSAPEPDGDPADLAREVKEKLPGLAEVFESPDSGMHATDTVDYGICLDGELCLELDDGKEVLLTPGCCVVQLGTRHAWHNRGDKPALMCFVSIGARRDLKVATHAGPLKISPEATGRAPPSGRRHDKGGPQGGVNGARLSIYRFSHIFVS
jgi:mannose-6-phosphate isomerase-like protein (cupin superfamily)